MPQLLQPPTYTVPFPELYHSAKTVEERLILINLAKQYFIRIQEFEEAYRYRKIERALKADCAKAVATLGVDALKPNAQT